MKWNVNLKSYPHTFTSFLTTEVAIEVKVCITVVEPSLTVNSFLSLIVKLTVVLFPAKSVATTIYSPLTSKLNSSNKIAFWMFSTSTPSKVTTIDFK